METKENIILEDCLIFGEWRNEVIGDAKYSIEPAEKGLKDKYGQLVTPNFGTTIIIKKFIVEKCDVLSQLSVEDISYIYELIEKDLEYA